MTYSEAIDWLYELRLLGSKLGLKNPCALAAHAGGHVGGARDVVRQGGHDVAALRLELGLSWAIAEQPSDNEYRLIQVSMLYPGLQL